MAKRKRNTKSKSLISLIALIIILISVILGRNNEAFNSVNTSVNNDVNVSTSDIVKVHFIDVGQGSSTLVQCGNTGILIDAGEREYGKTVVDYLKTVGIEHLEYVIASHPHSDHIGGMLDVFDAFPINNVVMPELTEINMPTTRLYENFMSAIIEKDINAIVAESGDRYTVGASTVEIWGPIKQVKDLNNMSVICRVWANSVTFMVTGDAEKQELSSVTTYGVSMKCDVIAMGHHGSRTSLEKDFLSAVGAKVAVISCGRDNSYGHPHEETIEYLESNGIEYYRTDYAGSIVFTCNDKGYAIG